jgi:hypothetical protein
VDHRRAEGQSVNRPPEEPSACRKETGHAVRVGETVAGSEAYSRARTRKARWNSEPLLDLTMCDHVASTMYGPPTRRLAMKRHHGYTLVELLIAVFGVLVISVA